MMWSAAAYYYKDTGVKTSEQVICGHCHVIKATELFNLDFPLWEFFPRENNFFFSNVGEIVSH